MPYYVDTATQHDSAINARLMVYAIFKRKWQVLGIIAVVVLSIVVAGLIRPSIYKLNSKVLIRPARAEIQVSAGDQHEITMPVSASSEMVNSEMEILRSGELMHQVITRMEQAGTPIFGAATTMPLTDQIGALQGMLAVTPTPQSNVISIDLFARDPEKGAVILNTLIQAYLERHAQVHGNTGVTEFFENQKSALRDRMADAETKLATYIDSETMVMPEEQIRSALKDASRGRDTVATQAAKIRGLQRRVTTLRSQIASTPSMIERDIEHEHPTAQGLALELSKKEAEQVQLAQAYQPEDRLMRDKNSEIADLRQRLATAQTENVIGTRRVSVNPVHQDLERRLLNSQMSLDDLQARVEGLQGSIDRQSLESTRRAIELRQKSIEFSRLQLEVTASRDAFQLYEKKQQEARISAALDHEGILNVSVLDTSTVPTQPFNRPNPLMIIAALVVGTGLGVGTAVGREFLGRNFKFEEQVEQYLELPVFAVIPDLSDVAELQQAGQA
jgi:succinoglycan biosynthesis transport protein ExoP